MTLRLITLFFILFCSFQSNAGSQSGFVDYITVRAGDGIIYFQLKDGPLVDRPACATLPYWIIKDENSKAAEQQYAMLLSAKASKTKVTILGTNECTRWFDGEDVNAIEIR